MKSWIFGSCLVLSVLSQSADAEFLLGSDLKTWCQMEPGTYQRVYCEALIDGYSSASVTAYEDPEGNSCLIVRKTYDADRVRRAILKLLLVDAPGEYESSGHGIVIHQAMVNAEMISEACRSHKNWSRFWDDRIL